MRYDAQNATSRQQLLTAVNALYAHGGGDCPELGMTGIINALGLSFPGGQLIVLTDASAKDLTRTAEAIQAAFTLGVRVHFAFSHKTGCALGYPFYDRIANETGGFSIYRLNDLDTLSNAVQSTRAAFNEADDAGSNITSVAMGGCKAIHVSLLAENFYIAINPGTGTAEVSLQMPNGNYVFRRMLISALLIQNFTSPASGEWLVCIYNGSADVKQSQNIRFDIVAEFLVKNETTGMYLTYSKPPFTRSEVVTILFSSRHADLSTSQLHKLRLVDVNGDLTNIPLLRCNRFLEGRFILPSVQYRLHFFGFDSDNNSIVIDLGAFPAGPQPG